MGSALSIALLSLVVAGCLPEKTPVSADGAPADADPLLPDAVPPPDAPPLTEGVTALAGSDTPGNADGPRNVASFNNPVNVVVADDGGLFVADFDNDRVRRVSPEGVVSTLVEQPLFQRPFGLLLTANGTLYVQTDDNDAGEHSIETGTLWRVDPITDVASPVARNLGRPRGLCELPDGRIVMADMMHHTLSVLNPTTGQITLLAGMRDQPGMSDGVGLGARFNRPYDVVYVDGALIVTDFDNHCLRRVTLAGAVSVFSGTCSSGFKDGPASEARFDNPQALAVGADGTVYVTDLENYRIRAVDAAGAVTTFAGDGMPGFLDGPHMQARFFGLEGIDIGAAGDYLYVADGSRGEAEPYHRIRRISID